MKILIRVDIGRIHGYGHAVRCRALAQVLADAGAEVRFVTATDALAAFVSPFPCGSKHASYSYTGGDTLVFDHKTDFPTPDHLHHLLVHGCKVVLLDTKPPEESSLVNLVVFPNAHTYPTLRRSPAEDIGACFLTGWPYVMLAKDVAVLPPLAYQPREMGSIVFCAGGSDPGETLAQLWEWAESLPLATPQVFCVGAGATGSMRARLDDCQDSGLGTSGNRYVVPFHVRYLQQAAMVISTMGQTAYEALWYQTPTFVIGRTSHDADDAVALQYASQGACAAMGNMETLTRETFCNYVTARWHDMGRRHGMHAVGYQRMDGQGVARVAAAILRVAKGESLWADTF